MPTTLDLRGGSTRGATQLDWLDSRHSFNFGSHHEPGNTHHGLLIVSNDDRVAPGGGFGAHPHRDMEIITWVLDGALEHRDSEGNHGVLRPGLAQRMSAGRGIRHAELNASRTEPVHFIQMWVVPDELGIAPGYEQRDMTSRLDTGELVPVASGMGHEEAISIHQGDAAMWAARLAPGAAITLPDNRFVHLYVAKGGVTMFDRDLTAGDAARLTDAGSPSIRATDAAEVIVWESGSEVTR